MFHRVQSLLYGGVIFQGRMLGQGFEKRHSLLKQFTGVLISVIDPAPSCVNSILKTILPAGLFRDEGLLVLFRAWSRDRLELVRLPFLHRLRVRA